MSVEDDPPTPERPDPNEERLDSLYARLKPLSEAEREALIERECAGEPELAAELRELLAPGPPSDFLVPPTAGENAQRFFGGALEGETLGEFTLVRELGRGSMGVVYLAEQQFPRRHVALKVLPAAHAQDPLRAERFRREAEAASHIDHPNVVPILAYGGERGQLWFAMRYIDGHDLHAELDRHRRLRNGQPTPLPFLPPYDGPDYVRTMVERFCELLDALQRAHEKHVVHRDVKPQNILVDREGHLHLADFGLARDDRFGSLTQTGAVQGTPNYMSPEQARVLEDAVDHRTDVYSAAVVLYEMLGLQRAFSGATEREVLQEIGTREPIPLARFATRVPRDLEVICTMGMAKRPERRYASARAFADDLRRFLRHEAIHARPPTPLERAGRFVERHRRAVLAGALLLAGVSFAAWFVQEREARTVLAAEETRFSGVLSLSDWSGRVPELVAARRRLLDLRASGRTLPRSVEEVVLRLERRLAEHKDELVRRGTELVDRGLAGRDFEVPQQVLVAGTELHPEFSRTRRSGRDERAIGLGLQLLQEACTIYWDDPQLAELADVERTWPLLDVELPPEVLQDAQRAHEARAFVRSIDPIEETYGAPRELGTLPVRGARLAPGYYRIVVEIPDFGFGEYARYLGIGTHAVRILAHVRRTDDVVLGMKRIEGGAFTYRVGVKAKNGQGCAESHTSVELLPYWIGEAEVSNAEVVEYLRATHVAPPKLWWDNGYRRGPEDLNLGPGLERWLELPAVGYSGNFAREFAEWRGARFPTHPELERAHRGPGGFFYPWGDELPKPDGVLCNVDRTELRPAQAKDFMRVHLAGALPVREEGYRQPPELLFHTYGNVGEWTESLIPVAHDGVLEVNPHERIVMGIAWHRDPADGSLCNHNIRNMQPQYMSIDYGIRLAKSVRP